MKYIFISGGVISGLGKGITTASVAALLSARGYRVAPIKADMYINIDAGTIRPQEHGEVFVTDDGIETDQDLGHYERFLHENLTCDSYMTTGQIYKAVIEKERSFGYNGEDVEAIPHVTDEIIRRITTAGKVRNAQIVIIELGGTAGEIQNSIFFEASRIFRLKHPHDVIQVHIAYLPTPASLGELKSKPVQLSVHLLNSMGIQPDFVIGRSEKRIDEKRRERIALFCNVSKEKIISNPDVYSIYELPLVFEEQDFSHKLLEKLGLPARKQDFSAWRKLVDRIHTATHEITIAVVGKYFATGDYQLADVYVSIIEALKHAAWSENIRPKLHWIDSEKIEKQGINILEGFDGYCVTPGFGGRGIEGMIEAVRFARENKAPYLGLCYGMQMATIEFARNVVGLKKANTTEVDPKTPHPVIHIMPEQEKRLLTKEYGATMRLGAWPCVLKTGTIAQKAYASVSWPPVLKRSPFTISERHRHRYELNNAYRKKLENAGLVISGTTPDGLLAEVIELPDHPFFVGTQYHPEFQSRPLTPQPLFKTFVRTCNSARSRKLLS